MTRSEEAVGGPEDGRRLASGPALREIGGAVYQFLRGRYVFRGSAKRCGGCGAFLIAGSDPRGFEPDGCPLCGKRENDERAG